MHHLLPHRCACNHPPLVFFASNSGLPNLPPPPSRRDPKNATFGPVLKRLVVAKHLRCRGLGRALLGEVERVAADHFPPLLPCVEMVLQLGEHRVVCRGLCGRGGVWSLHTPPSRPALPLLRWAL